MNVACTPLIIAAILLLMLLPQQQKQLLHVLLHLLLLPLLLQMPDVWKHSFMTVENFGCTKLMSIKGAVNNVSDDNVATCRTKTSNCQLTVTFCTIEMWYQIIALRKLIDKVKVSIYAAAIYNLLSYPINWRKSMNRLQA